ncbi:MAG: branched-chain amino acid transaminase [Candidatus Margulisbacteria bacterium]|nr:branched-chain amino acid transaminase [Candidatus Margulisiibacteriota bacterium]
MKFAYFQGKIVPFEEAKISVMTHAFNYGTGVFEGIRAYWNDKDKQLYVLKMKEHYERFLKSCKILNIDIKKSVKELIDITTELIKKNGYKEDVYIRPLAYKSSVKIGVRLHDLEDDFTIYMSPFGDYLDVSKGIRCCVSSWTRIDDTMIPARGKITGIYVNSAFSKSEAMLNGYDEALVMDSNGHVVEGSAENLFIIRDGVAITPQVNENILEGITRQALIKMLKEEIKIEVIERAIDRSELYIADEVFLCGTGAQVSPVVEIDHKIVAAGKPGEITMKLSKIYFDAVKGINRKYSEWLTPVY